MKFVVWGAGIWGKRIHQLMTNNQRHEIVAFIDQEESKQQTNLLGCPVISYEKFKKNHTDCFLIISIASEQARDEIREKLKIDQISCVFWHIDCPSEMIFLREKGIPFEEIRKESMLLERFQKIIISGNTLFSILCYDYLQDQQVNMLALAFGVDEHMNQRLQEEGYKMVEEKKDYEVILHTNDGWMSQMRDEDNHIEHMDFRDFSYLQQYQNEKIKLFHHKYAQKKRCFIVASGPSLRIEDLDKLHEMGEFCFSMNRVYLAFEKSQWRPKVYVVADGKALEDNATDFLELEVKHKFYSDASSLFWANHKEELNARSNIYPYHLTGNYFFGHEPEFSLDLVKGTYLGGTVVYDCIQFAVYMGFKEIYLLGVDCSFKKNGNEDEDHFIKGYAKTAKQPYFYEGLKWQFLAYRQAQKITKERGVKIFNATRGGDLEEFERVDFDTLFS